MGPCMRDATLAFMWRQTLCRLLRYRQPQVSGHRKLGTVPSCLGLALLSSGLICGLCGEVVSVVFRGLRGGERCVVGEWLRRSQGQPFPSPCPWGSAGTLQTAP